MSFLSNKNFDYDVDDPTYINPNLCSHCKKKNKMRNKDVCSTCNKNIAKADNIIDMDLENMSYTSLHQTCESCREAKLLNNYNFAPDNLKVCKECRRVYDKEYRKKHIKNFMFLAAQKRAKESNLDFNLTLEDLPDILPEYCPVLGIQMEVNSELRADNSFSLDRIDNSKGYVKGNVDIISWKANRLKSNATPIDLRKILAYMEGRNIP